MQKSDLINWKRKKTKDYLNWFESCEVHHKDGNVFNNTLENLECLTKEEHKEAHRQLRASKKKEV